MNELITVIQLPIIEEQLRTISIEIDKKVAIAGSLICSEDSVKQVKAIRAEFNKDFAEVEELRKAVKASVMAPYNEFEAAYKEHVSDKYKAADAILKTKIDAVECELKARKMEEVRAYFDEYAAAQHVDSYADFGRQMKDLRSSCSMKEFQRICRERIDALAHGLSAIDAQPEDIRAEILAEFRKTLNASEAISVVAERRKAIEAQREQQKAREVAKAVEAETVKRAEAAAPPPLAPPTAKAELEPKYTVAFTARDTRDVIAGLVRYMRVNNIEFKQIDLEDIKNKGEAKSA